MRYYKPAEVDLLMKVWVLRVCFSKGLRFEYRQVQIIFVLSQIHIKSYSDFKRVHRKWTIGLVPLYQSVVRSDISIKKNTKYYDLARSGKTGRVHQTCLFSPPSGQIFRLDVLSQSAPPNPLLKRGEGEVDFTRGLFVKKNIFYLKVK